jgi:transcriptional regulator NrdR family protein
MKRCAKDNQQFSDDRRFCSTCGARLVEELEMTTLIMPKMKIKRAEFFEMNDDLSFRLSIGEKDFKLSIDEVKILAAEINSTVEAAKLHRARPED